MYISMSEWESVCMCVCVSARMLTFVAQCKYHMLTKQLPFELKLQANQQQLPLATG